MIAPTLLVGLGGTGSTIIAKVSELVTEEQRSKIEFVVMDTDINDLRYLKEKHPFVKTIQTSSKLTVGQYLNIDTKARDEWFPVNGILNTKSLTEGAGQVRAISRLAFDTAVKDSMGPLHEAIGNLYKLEEEESNQALRVIIVSSLAGGTGSGILLPVAMYIRQYLLTKYQASASIVRGFFVLPSVFYQVIKSEIEKNNLRCNAYAALRELDAFLMKGDHTLPKKYEDKFKIEFPSVTSEGYEEYDVRPYDFCFLFDAQNTEGNGLNNFSQYLDHAANCIYSQSIGPMNKRSNSSEDNTIRVLCKERGRNRYAGAGSSLMIYPVKDVTDYITYKWAKANVSDQWMVFDKEYKEKCRAIEEMKRQGYQAKVPDPAQDYVDQVNAKKNEKNPFAMDIVNSCTIFDDSGLIPEGNKWEEYIGNLNAFVENSISTGQPDLDEKRTLANTNINQLEENKDAESFIDAYKELSKYKALIDRRCDDLSRTISYSLFHDTLSSVTKSGSKHQLESYLRDGAGMFIHPNAVRYFLYQAKNSLLDQKRQTDNDIKDAEEFFANFEKKTFDNTKTEEEETIDQLGEWVKKRDLDAIKTEYRKYLTKADDYRLNLVKAEVYNEAIKYVQKLADAFKNFYQSFEGKISEIDRKTAMLAKKYANASGKTTRYVCASKLCMEKMAERASYVGNSNSLNGELAENIYIKVRQYALMADKPVDESKIEKGQDGFTNSYFGDIFDKGIVDYFRKKILEVYGGEINIDILTALEREIEFEQNVIDPDEKEIKVKKIIYNARKLSTPFIEQPLGEERQSIDACAYNPALDPKDDSPRSNLIASELSNNGGVASSDIPINMIMFYKSIYGLRANNLSKFAPKSEQNQSEGEYYKAYFDIVSQIKPRTDETPVITPHLDKNWHIISFMPDLDESNQKAQERAIYKALFYGFLLDQIIYKQGENKKIYKLQIGDPQDFVVSNGTACDHFYEVLDALTINPTIVKAINEESERKIMKQINGSGNFFFDTSLVKKSMDKLAFTEFDDHEGRTIFDIPALLKESTPSADFDQLEALNMLRVFLDILYDYIGLVEAPDEVGRVFGQYIVEQFGSFLENMNNILTKDDGMFNFVDDMARVAREYLINKNLDDNAGDIEVLVKSKAFVGNKAAE